MKVYFADDVDSMISELVSQAAKSVRVHVLKKVERDVLVLQLYLTAYCNNQIFESVKMERHSLQGVKPEEMLEFAGKKASELRESFAETKLRNFEVKAGIYQPD